MQRKGNLLTLMVRQRVLFWNWIHFHWYKHRFVQFANGNLKMRDVVLNVSSDQEENGKFIVISKSKGASSMFIKTVTYNQDIKNGNCYKKHSGYKWGNLNMNLGKKTWEVYSVLVTEVTDGIIVASTERPSCRTEGPASRVIVRQHPTDTSREHLFLREQRISNQFPSGSTSSIQPVNKNPIDLLSENYQLITLLESSGAETWLLVVCLQVFE